MNQETPDPRVTLCNNAPVRPGGRYVLYRMTAFRRLRWNFSLDRAAKWCKELGKPLVILETLEADEPFACDRFHRFVLDGMAEKTETLRDSRVVYCPYPEPEAGRGRKLAAALAARACVVVTDDWPGSPGPKGAGVRTEKVDSNGILPLSAVDRVYPSAYLFRRHLQKVLPGHLLRRPLADPLRGLETLRRADVRPTAFPERLPVDHSVPPVRIRGGEKEARKRLRLFLRRKLPGYAQDRNEPGKDATSGLSPYLHFGHVSAHEVAHEVLRHEGWTPADLSPSADGRRAGWWGVGESAEAFLDQLITWRELGFNMASRRSDFKEYASLPEWAKRTLDRHRSDPRSHGYTLGEFESAATHDELWNAAQRQLVREGTIHNYLRMLWGKKILQWSRSPEEALRIMIRLNDKYAMDGRDPNSYSGIFWVLGRYDRAWGPERPVFGTVRYMSSENTRRKVKVREYLKKYA